MSALGQKRTCAVQLLMSALPPKADMCGATRDVRYGPKADIVIVFSGIEHRELLAQARFYKYRLGWRQRTSGKPRIVPLCAPRSHPVA